jgi:hypothetical protein
MILGCGIADLIASALWYNCWKNFINNYMRKSKETNPHVKSS